jgi:hypothetical protein
MLNQFSELSFRPGVIVKTVPQSEQELLAPPNTIVP